MSNKIFGITVGILVATLGIEIFFTGGFWSKYHHVYSDYRGISKPLGIILFALAICIIWIPIKTKEKSSNNKNIKSDKIS